MAGWQGVPLPVTLGWRLHALLPALLLGSFVGSVCEPGHRRNSQTAPCQVLHSCTVPAVTQAVAIKVIDLLPDQRRQAAAAYRECQLISALHHECIVRVVTFYTAQVLRRRRRHSVATT
jgi:hypothetical protein